MKTGCRASFNFSNESADTRHVIAALRSAGYDGYRCAELSWDCTVDPDSAAGKTARRLRDMRGEE
jgi:hypothetical protein